MLCFSPLPNVELIKPVLDTTPEDLAAAVDLNVIAAASAVRLVVAQMQQRGGGTLLFTTGGAAISPSAERAVSGIAYAAETVYIAMLAEALAAQGVNVAQTVIVGAVGPGRRHEPDTVAEHLWQQHAHRGELVTVLS